jgi:hypothetical protein
MRLGMRHGFRQETQMTSAEFTAALREAGFGVGAGTVQRIKAEMGA